MRKRFLQVVAIAGMAVIFIAGSIDATQVIELNTSTYKKLTRPKIKFEHDKHAQDYAKKYPDVFKNGCGECHHDANKKPLTSLKTGDKVQPCIECHKEPGQKPAKEKLSKEEKIKKYHAEAVHENCGGCHQEYNKLKGLKSKDKGYAPTKARCNDCHKK